MVITIAWNHVGIPVNKIIGIVFGGGTITEVQVHLSQLIDVGRKCLLGNQ